MVLYYIIGETILSKREKRGPGEQVEWRCSYKLIEQGDWKRKGTNPEKQTQKAID